MWSAPGVAPGRRDTFAHVGKPEGTRLFAGRRRSERVGLQGPDAADDGQYVRENVHGEFSAGHGRVAPSNRHQWRHGAALGLVQGSRRADTTVAVLRCRPDQGRQLRVHSATSGRTVRQRRIRQDPVSERKRGARIFSLYFLKNLSSPNPTRRSSQ